MVIARSHLDLHNIRSSIERTKKMSDGVVKIGPFGIGLDGLLGFVPWAGALYSGGAGLVLVIDGVRARAAPMVLAEMSLILAVDTLTPFIPKAGGFIDALFTGHKWAADLLLRHMDETIYFEGSREQAMNSAEYRDLMARVRAGKEQRRVVFLGRSPKTATV
ncbi:DUF4112 domain-containing protein [Caulobacter mirabilis]|uniref:DUF4112 domain-containing protein n=1 Tax=Caulobacter mirabilis TaxID=69666 RepID=A0A2D2AZY5_9CAUL|nr:DUF4112 domain-containing protein [Caulobacter mirabilis]ATQ43555.1 hypothetical protein CSW64_14660 [Caulobacter mirabilis]